MASAPLPEIAFVPLSCVPANETGAKKTATSDAPRVVATLALFARIIFIAPIFISGDNQILDHLRNCQPCILHG
jgi:hypothetical protein